MAKAKAAEGQTADGTKTATKNTFATIKVGQTIYFQAKGQKNGTTVIKVRLDKDGLAFKTSDGHGVTMTEKEAYQSQYKSPRNTLWTLK
jgi:hypothetical protein